jgi:sialidase-1
MTRFLFQLSSLFAALVQFAVPAAADAPLKPVHSRDVFTNRTEGYHTFRIPAIIATPKGTLLAFSEGRKNSRSDAGDIDLVLKRSTDGGKTWGKLQIVWNDGQNTCGNPCPVVDETTGRIWLPMTWNHGKDRESQIQKKTSIDTRRVYITYSDDDGKTWAKPNEITAAAKKPAWTWYATGPGNAIQIRRGRYKGRLVVPCDHNLLVAGKNVRRSHCLTSDDHGKTWKISESVGDHTNECAVVELTDGRLLLNMRSYHGKHRRAISHSGDGGATWSPVKLDDALIEPVCQGNILRYSWPGKGGKSRILFSNPASRKRDHMTVRLSYDDGKTWPVSRLVYAGSAAYSNLVALPGGRFGLLYERDGYRRITFGAFTIKEFTGGKD